MIQSIQQAVRGDGLPGARSILDPVKRGESNIVMIESPSEL